MNYCSVVFLLMVSFHCFGQWRVPDTIFEGNYMLISYSIDALSINDVRGLNAQNLSDSLPGLLRKKNGVNEGMKEIAIRVYCWEAPKSWKLYSALVSSDGEGVFLNVGLDGIAVIGFNSIKDSVGAFSYDPNSLEMQFFDQGRTTLGIEKGEVVYLENCDMSMSLWPTSEYLTLIENYCMHPSPRKRYYEDTFNNVLDQRLVDGLFRSMKYNLVSGDTLFDNIYDMEKCEAVLKDKKSAKPRVYKAFLEGYNLKEVRYDGFLEYYIVTKGPYKGDTITEWFNSGQFYLTEEIK